MLPNESKAVLQSVDEKSESNLMSNLDSLSLGSMQKKDMEIRAIESEIRVEEPSPMTPMADEIKPFNPFSNIRSSHHNTPSKNYFNDDADEEFLLDSAFNKSAAGKMSAIKKSSHDSINESKRSKLT